MSRTEEIHLSLIDFVNSPIGPLLICKKGALLENSFKRKSVDKEFVILFTEIDENKSWLLDDNIQSFSNNPNITKAKKNDPEFVASNKMASINGYIYGNMPGLDMCQDDKVSWHMIGVGEWSDVHNREYILNYYPVYRLSSLVVE